MDHQLLAIADELCAALSPLRFAPPVTHVYNPLVYAREPYAQYVERYATGPREIVLLGMNPGPFGMTQTGVPFGEIASVRDWLGVTGRVLPPRAQHPARPVEGFACKRSEVSGARLWGFFKKRFGEPTSFFERFFVLNYCPLVFMEASGKNRTPNKLPREERRELFAACDRALTASLSYLAPRFVIGVGAFAKSRIEACVKDPRVTKGQIPHPSPASPLANRGFAEAALAAMTALGIRI